jgi:hypothetical protein
MTATIVTAAFVTMALACATPAQAECPYDWLPGEGVPGTNGMVSAAAVSDDVFAPALYVGGWFTAAGSAVATCVAKWDPVTQTWSALGSGPEGVCALAILDGKLYAGGEFRTAGGVSANHIACWDPPTRTWSPLGSGTSGTHDSVFALTVLDGKLYVGGSFDTAGEVSANHIACWDPATQAWSALGSGMSGERPFVRALIAFEGKLYAGGEFAGAGGVSANGVACWDPIAQTWSALGSGMWLEYWDPTEPCWCGDPECDCGPLWVSEPGMVLAFGTDNGKLYAGGWFTAAGGASTDNIACWDPPTETWSVLGSGISSSDRGLVRSLSVLDGKLYAGGEFTTAGGASASYIAGWNPATQTWSPVGGGTSGGVYALASLNRKVYAGGWFSTAGDLSADNIACWEPTTGTWSPLGSGATGHVEALAALDGRVYMGGDLTTASGVSAYNIACWDPPSQTWSPLGAGMREWDRVDALTVLGSKLYVGGSFYIANGIGAIDIACWDPATQTWSALSRGTNGEVLALAVLGGKL